jgi:diaminopimelate decarboxylase
MHVAAAAEQVGETPAYIYDLAVLRGRLRAVDDRIPWRRKRLFFATMANDHPAVLRVVMREGAGVFVNSPKHLRLALAEGFEPGQVIYAASNMSPSEMGLCLAARAHLVLDSLDQVEMLAAVAPPGTKFGVRVNVGSALDKATLRDDPEYRFGLLPGELDRGVSLAAASGLSIIGVHAYFGTDIMDPGLLLEGLERLCAAGQALPDLEYVDGGGGFGVPDELGAAEFDLARYGAGAAAIMQAAEIRLGRPLALYLEPGRFVSAPCGWFFARAIGRKARADRTFVGLGASVVQLPRMLIHPATARHPWRIVGREEARPGPIPVWLCGNSTYSRDFLARDCRAPAPEPGELVVFHNAGAYSRSMLTDFLGKDRPSEIIVDSAQQEVPAIAWDEVLVATFAEPVP